MGEPAEPAYVGDQPIVSVLVSTYRRSAMLPALMARLEAQTIAAPFEVVIIDNGSDDDTGAVLAALRASTALDLRTDRLATNRGPAAGRNRAVELARGRWLAFTDDDCRPSPDWLRAGVAAMEDGARIAVGRTEPMTPRAGAFSRTLHVTSAQWFPTANVFYSREDVVALGAFDPVFTTPGGEDTDLAWRVLACGGDAVFVGDALVEHPTSPNSFAAAIRTAWRWADLPLVLRRHPERRREIHRRLFWKPSHVPASLGLVGLVAAPAWTPSLLLLAPPRRPSTRPQTGGRQPTRARDVAAWGHGR